MLRAMRYVLREYYTIFLTFIKLFIHKKPLSFTILSNSDTIPLMTKNVLFIN